jgi:hypothetical protein
MCVERGLFNLRNVLVQQKLFCNILNVAAGYLQLVNGTHSQTSIFGEPRNQGDARRLSQVFNCNGRFYAPQLSNPCVFK